MNQREVERKNRLERIERTRAQLLQVCTERQITITADERVSETDAAVLLGCAAGSLKNMRTLGTSPPFYRRAMNNSRVSYRLSDLAEWIENGREDW